MASYPQRIEALLRNPRRGTTRPVPHPSTNAPMPPLAVRSLDDGRELALDRELAIGRAPDNDLVLADAAVSARHCLLVREPRGPVVHDCGSTNGTFLNWVRIERAELAEGALIVVGSTHLRVVAARMSAPATAVPGADALEGIIGRSQRLRAALADVKRVARSHLSVLVLGESGTGKELVARAIHALSARAAGPFVAVNCSAIPREVAESELFGHERGAFTGAFTARPGVFEEAAGGTLLLDEVGDLPAPLQPKLLRALETRIVRRVGGRSDVRVDVRVVAATNRELAATDFRSDLYHRLAAVVVRLPALRERPEDVETLIEHFLAGLAAEHGARVLAPGALSALRAYRWPGNVRELRNAVERAVVLSGGPVLTARDLLPPAPVGSDGAASDELIGGRTLDEIEREAIGQALVRTRGNQRAAALMLGLPRTTLADRARRYGLLRRREA